MIDYKLFFACNVIDYHLIVSDTVNFCLIRYKTDSAAMQVQIMIFYATT